MFEEEDRPALQQRIRRARKRRERIAAEARFKAYVEGQPWRNVSLITPDFKRRVVKRADPALAKALPDTAAAYFADAEENYRYAVRAGIVNHEFTTMNGSAKLAAANVQPVQLRFPVPEQGCVNLAALPLGRVAVAQAGRLEAADVALEPLAMLLGDVQAAAALAQPLLLDCMHDFYRELDVRHLLLVDTHLPGLHLPAALDDFVSAQREFLDKVASQLTTEWLLQVVGIVERVMPTAPAPAADAEAANADGGSDRDSDAGGATQGACQCCLLCCSANGY